MINEQELLEQLVTIQDSDVVYPYDVVMTLERELAKLYMPQLDANVSNEELIKWGAEFKSIVAEKEKMFRQNKGI